MCVVRSAPSRRMAPALCPKSFAPGRASHKKAVHAALICGSRDPRRTTPARCPKKLRPEVGPPTKNSARRPHLWEPQPAANGAGSVPEKLRPEVGPPTKQCTPPSFVGAVIRGEWRQRGARKSFGPRSDLPLKAVHVTLICGRRDPRRMASARCPKSFAPRSGLPQKAVHAALICRSRDPRRTAPARCPKSFAPGRASHKKQCTPPSFVGAATRDEWRQPGARKSFGLRSDLPLKAVHAAPIVGAAPSRRMAPARCPKKLRPEVGPPTKSSACHPHLWEPRPAANGASSVREELRPGSGLPQKQRCTPPQLWEARPAANGASSVREELRPEVGRPTKSSARRPTLGCQGIGMSLASQDS